MADGLNTSTQQGEGAAQIFRPNDLSYIDRELANQQRERHYKRQEEGRRGNEFNKGLASLHNLDIFHAHQPYFAQKQNELYQWAKAGNAADIIKNGDTSKMMDFQKKVADLQTEANMSKNYGQQVGKLGTQLLNKDDQYTPESHDYFQEVNQPIDVSKLKEGEGPNYALDLNRVQKEVAPKEILNYVQDIKGKNIETGGYYKDPKTNQNVNFTTEYYPRKKANEDVDLMLQEPRYYAHFHRKLDAMKDPAEKLLYTNKDGSLDVNKFAQDELATALVKDKSTKATASGGGNGMNLTFGNGMATNGKYNFVTQDRIKEEPTPTIFDKNKKKVTPYKVISIQRTDAGENKGFFFDDPNHEGKKIEVIPKEYEQKANGDWSLIGVPKNGGKEIHIPEKDVTADMKAITGVDLNEIIQGEGNTDETKVSGSKAVPSNLIARKDKSGRVALFDKNKKFVRWQ